MKYVYCKNITNKYNYMLFNKSLPICLASS